MNTRRVFFPLIAALFLGQAATTQAEAAKAPANSGPCTGVMIPTERSDCYSALNARGGKPEAKKNPGRYMKIVPPGVTENSTPKDPAAPSSNIVRSGKTGAFVRISATYQKQFQGFITDVEAYAENVRVEFMGSYRAGPCHMGSKHPCGRAIDYCQLARGVVHAKCNLPPPSVVAAIARRHGLIEGGVWCSSDYGHVEAGAGVTGCSGRQYRVGRAIWPAQAAKKVRVARHP